MRYTSCHRAHKSYQIVFFFGFTLYVFFHILSYIISILQEMLTHWWSVRLLSLLLLMLLLQFVSIFLNVFFLSLQIWRISFVKVQYTHTRTLFMCICSIVLRNIFITYIFWSLEKYGIWKVHVACRKSFKSEH